MTLTIDTAVHRAIGFTQARKPDEALGCLRGLKPGAETSPIRANLIGLIHLHAKAHSAALTWLDRALELDPASKDALSNRGAALQDLGRKAEALACYDAAVRWDLENPVLYYNRGTLLREAGRLEEAIASLDIALKLDPAYPEALRLGGMVLRDLGHSRSALEFFDEAVRLRPNFVDALNDRGNLLQSLDRPGDALASYDAALRQRPNDPELLNNRGSALQALGRFEAASADFDAALEIRPLFPEAWSNRGNLLLKRDVPDAALAAYDKALALRPGYLDALCGRAVALKELSRFDEALAAFDAALTADPHSAHVTNNKAALLLLRGEFASGWDLYESRWICGQTPKYALKLPIPEWNGEPLAGRRLLVFDEQGLGDAIQFARYLPLLAERGATITFFCRRPLHRLFHALAAPVRLVDDLDPTEGFDHEIALSSLPRVLATRASTIPAPASYLRAEPHLVRKWAQRIGSSGFKIGLCWRGSTNLQADAGRAVPLGLFAPLAGIEGIRLVSIQKPDPEAPFDDLAGVPRLVALGEDFDAGDDAFVDTAAAMQTFDLVITCDTAIAHLAGALGRPVFVLLKKVPDWRWLLDREDCPWYPTMRLFRQEQRNDWEGVMRRVVQAVRGLLAP